MADIFIAVAFVVLVLAPGVVAYQATLPPRA